MSATGVSEPKISEAGKDVDELAKKMSDEDAVLLESQSRRWLESMLMTSLPSTPSLAEQLSDGEILLKLAEKLQEFLRGKGLTTSAALKPELRAQASLLNRKSFAARANVEVFLSFCKELQVHPHQMCTSPDITEPINYDDGEYEEEMAKQGHVPVRARRLFVCLRALAARAKIMQLPVFEFAEVLPQLESGGTITSRELPQKPSGAGDDDSAPLPLLIGAAGAAAAVVFLLFIAVKKAFKGSEDAEVPEENVEETAETTEEVVVEVSEKPSRGFNVFMKQGNVYQVKSGDTLYGISRKFGKSDWKELAEKNPAIGNPDLIYPADRIIID